jgi:hypothetical protein
MLTYAADTEELREHAEPRRLGARAQMTLTYADVC